MSSHPMLKLREKGTVSHVNESLGFRIARASLDDLDELVALEDRVFTAPWTRKAFEAELTGNEFSRILVARPQRDSTDFDDERFTTTDRLSGYICMWTVFEELRLMNIAVEPDMQRKGIGSALVKSALETGIKQGAERALLEVREANRSAQALYARFGFSTYGTRLNYYTNPNENAMLMARDPLSLPLS